MTNRQTAISREIKRQNLANFRLVESSYFAGSEMPRHAHENAHISFVLKGSYIEQYEQKKRNVRTSFFIIHPPQENHSVKFHNGGARILNIQLKADWVECVSGYSKILDGSADFYDGIISSLAVRVYNEFRQMDEVAQLAIEGLLFEIVAETSRKDLLSERTIPYWLEQIKELLHARFTENLNFADIACTAEVHPVYLARQFRRFYRCTMSDYVRRLRIESACREIAKSNMSFSEIALQVGFYDQSHFANAFKKFTGITPIQYRRAFQKS